MTTTGEVTGAVDRPWTDDDRVALNDVATHYDVQWTDLYKAQQRGLLTTWRESGRLYMSGAEANRALAAAELVRRDDGLTFPAALRALGVLIAIGGAAALGVALDAAMSRQRAGSP